MSKELGLEQALRERGAVDRDERSLGTIRALVKRAHDELPPRTCFAGHQNGGVRRGNAFHDFEHRADAG